MIHVENVYEEILHQSLLDETLKGEEDLLGAEGTSGTGDPVRPARFLNRMEGEEEMATGLLGRQRRKEREEGERWRDVLAEVGMVSSSSRLGWYFKHIGPFVHTRAFMKNVAHS